LERLEKWIENISPRLEFLVVVLAAFGYFSIGSVLSLLYKSHKVVIRGEDLTFLLVYEITVLLVLGWFLKKRGWTLAQFGVTPSWRSTVMGVYLIPATYVMYAPIWITLELLFPEIQSISQSKVLIVSGISLWEIISVSVINPIFEEFFVCGYIIHSLKKSKNLWIAVMMSTFIRTLYHLYQPIQSIVAIVSIGLVFGFFYARTNRLWSVVVAHAIFDFWGLLRFNNG
jgi:uncharacterized protein